MLGLAIVAVYAGLNNQAAPFELFVTQSLPGPQNTDPANWSGGGFKNHALRGWVTINDRDTWPACQAQRTLAETHTRPVTAHD